MNLDFIYDSGAGPIVATGILVLFGLLIVGGAIGFIITVKKEREYANASLPDLFDPNADDEAVEETEELTESVFEIHEDDDELDDADSNQLMADIGKAKKTEAKVVSQKEAREDKLAKFTNIFKKKKKD